MRSIAILGAGLSGLSTAWFLKQSMGSNIRLAIFEKSSRPGGWIHTLQTENYLFEQGPRSCRTKGGEITLTLIESLALHDQVIVPHLDASKRYIFNGSKLNKLPSSIWEAPFNSLTKNWPRALWRDSTQPKRQAEDESIESFFLRRVGKSWTEYLVDPFISGIYAGDCKKLSIKSCFPLFDSWEQRQGSLILGALRHRPLESIKTPFVEKMLEHPLFSFQEGMETLPQALAKELKGSLRLGEEITKLNFHNNQVVLELGNRKTWNADQVISTIPMHSLSKLFPCQSPISQLLNKLSYASLVVVNLGYEGNILPIKGFGYLVPSKYNIPLLGCVWDSSIFPQQDKGIQTRLTLMIGGSRYPEVIEMAEAELIDEALQWVRSHQGICKDPKIMQISKVKQAIPQFEIGHATWKKEVEKAMQSYFPHLILSGSGWTGVSINECILHAKGLASEILRNNFN